MTAERLEVVCTECGQPRGAHLTTCSVYLGDLKAVKEEHAEFVKKGEAWHHNEGVTPEYDEQVNKAGVTLEQQLSELEELFKKPSPVAETAQAQGYPSEQKVEDKNQDILDTAAKSWNVAHECWDLIENMPQGDKRKEFEVIFLAVAKKLEAYWNGSVVYNNQNLGLKFLESNIQAIKEIMNRIKLFNEQRG
jgi:hypothetical protein